MVPEYNFAIMSDTKDAGIQFTIDDQFYLDTLLMDMRGKAISIQILAPLFVLL